MANVFKCLRPRIITNAAGNLVNVSCGKCEACLTKKSSNRARYCEIESKAHKHTFFVTLTYSQENLPVAKIHTIGDRMFLFNVTERLHYCLPHDFLGELTNASIDDIQYIHSRVYDPDAETPFEFGEGYIPFVSKYDAQTFLKRLRYYISQYSEQNNYENEKIRYYLVSEYGPSRFRPHFHLLLFFNADWLASEISGLLYKAWPLGRYDCSEAANRYGTASYVASYCNSLAQLPALYKSRGLRPFALHSVRFGEQAFVDASKKIFVNGDTRPIQVFEQLSDKIRTVFAPLSLQSALLPRCYHYVQTDAYMRYLLYNLYGRCIAEIGKGECSIDTCASYLLYINPCLIREIDSYIKETIDETNIRSILYASQRFYKLAQEYPSINVREKIEHYYQDYELRRLSDFYRSQQEFINQYGYDFREYFVHFYDNVYYKGMPSFLKKRFCPADIERSKQFYDTINIAWEFVDAQDIEYNKNPAYNDMKVLSTDIFRNRTKVKHHIDEFVKPFNY